MKILKVMILMVMMIVMSEANIIEETCKETPDFNLCVSLLKSDPRSSSADIFGIALILVDKIKGQGTMILNEINSQYKKRPELRPALDKCREEYETVVNSNVPSAITAITVGVPRIADDAVIDTDVEASLCEQEFEGKSPLTSLNQSMQKICSVTTAVIKMLL